MTVENERLALLPHTVRFDEAGRRIVQNASGHSFRIPDTFKKFYEMTEQGVSLAQMARFPVDPAMQSREGRFVAIARYLTFLYDQGLLADRRARQLAEALRSDFKWHESLAFGSLFTFELFRWPQGKPLREPMRSIIAYTFLIAGAIAAGRFTTDLYSYEVVDDVSAPSILIAFVWTFACARSLRSILQSVAMRFFGGTAAPLTANADCVSVSLQTDDLSRSPATRSYLIASAGVTAMMAATSPISRMMFNPAVVSLVPIFLALTFLADLSPFRRSVLTEWLRSLYNFWDRNRKDDTESKILNVHLGSAVLWALGFIGFAWGPSRHLYSIVRLSLANEGRSALLPIGLVGLALAVIAFSFIDDFASSWVSSSSDRIRRMWRRKSSSQISGEAVQQGYIPSQSELGGLPVLRQLDPETRRHLLAKAQMVDFKVGESVCRQGDSDRSLFFVLSGRLAIAKSSKGRRQKIVAFLDAGSVFGEAAFFLGEKRTADVNVMEDARILVIPHDPRMAQVNQSGSEELQSRIWFLQALVSSSLWKEIPADALDALVFAGRKHVFKGGEKIISEGEAADACYFVIQGNGTVVQNTRVINKVKAGDAFGEIALLNPGSLRTATVIADSEMLTVKIETEKFWHLLGSHLPLGLEVERLARRRLERDRTR